MNRKQKTIAHSLLEKFYMLTVRPIEAFEDNYIWMISAKGRSSAVFVDPGDADPVLEVLQRTKMTPAALLITHHHYDHTGGVIALTKRFDLSVYGPSGKKTPGLTHPLGEKDLVQIPQLNASFQVLEVPGHTTGDLAYYGEGCLFCGDTLFTGGCGRLFEGAPEQMQASLEKILDLPDETLVYCAHEYTQANLRFAQIVEPDNLTLQARIQETDRLRAQNSPTVPSTLKLEKETNPFLRWTSATVKQAAAQFSGKTPQTPAEIFSAIRRWKDALD